MKILFGPAGIGGAGEAIENLEIFSKAGLRAAEIAFTYSIYLKKEDAVKIGKKAKELGINLSIHAPYYINFNSKEKGKKEASKKRILDCCEIAHFLGAKRVVFHCGYYIHDDEKGKEEAFQTIKKEVIYLQGEIKRKGWQVILCPEIIGRRNVFGSIEEIARLKKETGCGFCIDFAHVLARYGESRFEELKKNFNEKEWHCHFSGIIYGDNGEKKHRDTKKEEWKDLIKNLPKDKEITIICESPNPLRDAIEGMRIYNSIR